MLNIQNATEIVKKYIAKMKGYDIKVQDRLLIDFLDFEVEKTIRESGILILYVSLLDGLLSGNRNSFKIKLKDQNGEIIDFEKIKTN